MGRITSIAHNLRLIFSRKLTDRIGETENRLIERADRYEKAVDLRLDERFEAVERRLDERLETVERRLDERMEAHERRTDNYLLQSRVEIIDRADVMLQIFEQRLDRQRREIQAMREALAARDAGAKNSDGSSDSEARPAPNVSAPNGAQSPADQILSFRRLAENAGWPVKQKLQSNNAGNAGGSMLYQRILDWKKESQDGLNDFSADEQEMVDYILSFISDPGDRAYAMQHMRRFIGTLQRIPPPQSSSDRLLELGSLMHLAPAIKKFCGYQEVCGADFWESDEKLVYETVAQKSGADAHTFELRNFNVERDPFPWPDNHFRVALCCEILEHLQSDPMHMLWELNRTLAPDGFLLLTTPNIVSARSIEGLLVGCAPYLLSQYNRKTPIDQHNREYAPYEVGVALAAAGFTVVELETEDVWMRSNPAIIELLKEVNLPTENRGDNIFALARKTGAPVERYPKELYVD
ncbi:MAG TPA: methyltransferase domain-containing protein [Blastocatellia bacterium]|jgi:SAM-dependent methyltransferase